MGQWKVLAEEAKEKRFEELIASGMDEDEAAETVHEEFHGDDRSPI